MRTSKVEKWMTRGLRRGDLTALSGLAHGAMLSGHEDDSIQRLSDRGFVSLQRPNGPRVTVTGRVAVLLRRYVVKN